MLNRLIDYLQEKFPPNRVVALLTPLVFAPAAGFVSAWVAQHFPGINLDPTVVSATFIAGALSAVGIAYKWIDGWQDHEEREWVKNHPFPPADLRTDEGEDIPL